MTTLVGLLGRKAPSDKPAPPPASLDLDEDLFSALGTQMGGENEVVRNLLLDAGYKIGELDEIKATITRLIEPVGKTLRAFEVEKADRAALQTSLATIRADYSTLREEFTALEKKSGAQISDCARLRTELASSASTVATLEAAHADAASSLQAARAQVSSLEAQLHQETIEARRLREDNHRLDEKLTNADRRIAQIESELGTARQRIALADNEKRSLQASLDKAIGEAARMSRRVMETENALGAAQARLRQMDAHLLEINSERLRLSSALEDANERHESECASNKTRLDAMVSRAAAAEKLLNEAREHLATRSEEIRRLERTVSDLTLAQDTLTNKINAADRARGDSDARIHEIEQSRAVLEERNAALARNLAARESALGRSDEKISALADTIAALESQIEANRKIYMREIDEMKAALSREKVERAVAEGALEAGRKDLARVMREVMALQRRQTAQEPALALRSANAA